MAREEYEQVTVKLKDRLAPFTCKFATINIREDNIIIVKEKTADYMFSANAVEYIEAQRKVENYD